MKDPIISIVIPTLNSAKTLQITLESIRNNNDTPSYEILVIDQFSKDNTVDIAKKFGAKVLMIKERGAAIARNVGITKSRGEIIYFVDSDCILPPNTLSMLTDFFKKYKDADGVGGPLLPQESKNIIQKFANNNFLNIMQFPNELRKAEFRIFKGSLITGNCAYRRKLLVKIGAFDKTFKNYGEDIELCWRAIKNGAILYFWPMIKVYHVFPDNLKRLTKQYFKWGIASSKLRKKFWNKGGIDLFVYYLFIKSFLKIFKWRNPYRSFDILRCYTILIHTVGKIWGSIKEGVINL